jgi:hypothetical protein
MRRSSARSIMAVGLSGALSPEGEVTFRATLASGIINVVEESEPDGFSYVLVTLNRGS